MTGSHQGGSPLITGIFMTIFPSFSTWQLLCVLLSIKIILRILYTI